MMMVMVMLPKIIHIPMLILNIQKKNNKKHHHQHHPHEDFVDCFLDFFTDAAS